MKFNVAVRNATVPVALAAAATLISGVAYAATADRALGRVAGTDRFSTAVAISQAAFPNGAAVVYLARADAFADALAGSSLTKDGPILLVPACAKVPQIVLDEATRLRPQAVKAIGGQSAVCDDVLAQFAGAAGEGSATQPAATGPAGPPGPSGPVGQPGPPGMPAPEQGVQRASREDVVTAPVAVQGPQRFTPVVSLTTTVPAAVSRLVEGQLHARFKGADYATWGCAQGQDGQPWMALRIDGEANTWNGVGYATPGTPRDSNGQSLTTDNDGSFHALLRAGTHTVELGIISMGCTGAITATTPQEMSQVFLTLRNN